MERTKFKVGDIVVCVKGFYEVINEGEKTEVIEPENEDGFFTILGAEDHSYCHEAIDFIPEEIFDSPLYQALTEK